MSIDYQRRATLSHWTCLFFYCVLLALFSIHQLLRAEGISLVQWSIQCLPLLIFWFGLRKRHQRSYQYLCFVTLMYFINGVVGVMTPNPDAFDVILLIGSIGLFIASMMTARYQYLAALHQSKTQSETDQ